MAYFVLIGSTDPVTPARTFDLVEDEKLAIEMVRVLEDLRPATWSTILPVVARPGMQVRSHSALVEQAQQELDDRDDETRSQAEEVKREALRRLGRGQDHDGQPEREQEDDARLDVGLDPTLPPAIDLERRREARPRKEGLLARRRSRREDARRAGERLDVELDLVELADEARTSGPAWETVALDPELPAPNAPQSRSSAPGSLYGFGDARQGRPEHEDDVPPPVDREQAPKRPGARRFLAGRRRKSVPLTNEALPTENLPPWPAPPRPEVRSSRKTVEKQQRPLDARDEHQVPGPSAKAGATGRPRHSRGKADRSPAGDVDSVDVPSKPDRLDTPPVEIHDPEPAPATASSDDPAETIDAPEPTRKRRMSKPDRLHTPPVEIHDSEPAPATASSDDPAETIDAPEPTRKRRSAPASRPRRRAKRQDDQVSVEQAVADAEPSEGASLFSERVAEYTLDHQRQSARERRSGRDRRSGIDRREAQIDGFEGPDRRAGAERRSGGNRRRISA